MSNELIQSIKEVATIINTIITIGKLLYLVSSKLRKKHEKNRQREG